MEVKDIQGNILIDALVTEQAVKVDELMKQHSITLSWVSVTDEELPLGAYIEHEGVRYSLLAPYKPEQSDEATYAYKPVFEHPIMRWQYIPFFFYTYSEGKVVSKELDWNLTDNPANFMKAVCDAILNETGEDWSYEISADLSASASQSFSNTDIFSALNAIAGAFETEWWFEYANKIVYLSKASFGSAVTLEVGQNIGVPSKNQSKDGYYTRFYAFGSTRNIEQNYAGSNVNSIVNKRLTLNPAKYPNGYIDIREGLTESEILVKTLVFDDIYPSSSLAIADVKVRLMWRLDSDKKKVQIGTDSNGNPVYDQYAIWYFKVPGLQFDKDSIISGKPLSVHFNSGALNGREFELTYHDTEEDVETSDGTSIHVEKGDFEINFIEEGTFIIPAISGLVPNDGDEITLFNIKMPEEYKTSAYNDLEEAVLKEIAKQDVDNNNYTFESNKEAFFESNPNLTVGRKVLYKNGNSVLETRVIKLETQLDYAFEQKITIGNEQIKGNTQTLKEEVVNANQNIDLISAINESTQQLVQSYQRTQKALLDSMAKWGDMWQLDKQNNAVRTPLNLIVEGGGAFGKGSGGGGDVPTTSDVVIKFEGDDDIYAPVNGIITLPAYSEGGGEGGGIDEAELEQYLKANQYAKKSDIPSLNGYATEQWVNQQGFLTQHQDLSAYAKSDDVANTYATKSAFRVLIEDFEKLEEAVNPLFGYFDANGNANNALKLGGHSADYFATADALNTHITAFNNYKTTTDNRLKDLEALWYMDDEGNVHTTHNIVVDGGGAFGKGSGGGGDVPSGGGIDETQLWNILGTSGTQTIHSSHIPDLSGKYLSVNGGTINGFLYFNDTKKYIRHTGESSGYLEIFNETGTFSGLGLFDNGSVKVYTSGKWNDIIHYGNIGEQRVAMIAAQNTRSLNYAPYEDYNNGVSWHFKLNSTIGVDAGWGSFSGVLNLCPWSDSSGGSTHQLAFTEGGSILWRYGKTSWGGYKEIIHSGNIGLYNAGSATKLQDNTAYNAWGQTFFENGVPKNANGTLAFAEDEPSRYITKRINSYAVEMIRFPSASDKVMILNRYGIRDGYGLYTGGSFTVYSKTWGTSDFSVINGNVLIGTTSDNGAKLQIDGDIQHSSGVYYLGMGISGKYRYVNLGDYANTSYTTITNINANTWTRWIDGSGTEIMRVDHTGNSYRLDVKGSLNATTVYQNGTTLDTLLSNYLLKSGGAITRSDRSLLLLKNTNAEGQSTLWLGGDFETFDKGGFIAYGGKTGDVSIVNFKAYNNNTNGLSAIRITSDNKVQVGDVNFTEGKVYDIYHTGNFNPANYLPLSGGTIEGGFGALVVKRNKGYASGIRFDNTNGILGYIGIAQDGTAQIWDANQNAVQIIHSSNIGDYAIKNYGNQGAIDFNNVLYNGIQYTSGSSSNNGKAYGVLLSLHHYDSSWHIVGGLKNGALLYRSGNGTANTWGGWKTIAFTDSNVASATKLQTARTIWGQSFDGSGDVSGDLGLSSSGIYWANDITNYSIKPASNYEIIYKGYRGHSFITAGGERLKILSNGNILMGATTDNRAKLQVSGASGNGLPILSVNSSTDETWNYMASFLAPNTSVNNGVSIILGHSYASKKACSLTYRMTSSSNYLSIHHYAVDDILNIFDSGNVIIGTTSDNGCKFQVNGTTPSYFYNSRTRYSLVVDGGLASKMITFGGWNNNEKAQVGYTDGSGFNIFNYQSYRDNNSGAKITAVGITDTGIFYVANSGNPGPDSAYLKVETAQTTVTGNLTVTGGGAFGSDIRYKDITSYRQIDLETIVKAPLFTFKWTDREDKVEHLGTSAQYWLDTQFKDAVNTTNKDFFHLDYGALAVGIGISVAREVKGVKTEVELLRNEVRQLKEKLNKYEQVWQH